MKQYIKPEFEIIVFETDDIITDSAGGSTIVYSLLKTKVNGNEGTDYKAQDEATFTW